MPEGQFTGERKTYIYRTDNNEKKYLITTDATLGDLTGTGLVAATTANSTDASPTPKGFKPRVVYWQGELDDVVKRKKLICGTTAATYYNSDVSQSITVDGVAGSTTGRRGERLTFPNLETADAGGG